MALKAQLLDVEKRKTPFDKSIGIIKNGEDNLYPERIDRYINNSVTAKMAAQLLAAYLVGKGFGNLNELPVNQNLTLQRFTSKLARSFARQNGAFIHVNYNLNYLKTTFDVLPYSHCRLGKKDDKDYNGKILVYNNWAGENGRIDKTKIRVLDVYNPNPKVVQAQITKAGGIDNYKGQILYINLDYEYDYALSPIDSVQYDCDSEAQASIFKNKSLRKGFFGKTLIITKPLIGNEDTYPTVDEFRKAESERDAFKGTIDNFIGVENTGGALHVEIEHDAESLEDAIKVQNIAGDVDDKLFEYTETSVFENILMAFDNVPEGLLRSASTMFGQSGEGIKEMKITYQENTTQKREELEQVINELFKNSVFKVDKLKIIPLIENVNLQQDVNQ